MALGVDYIEHVFCLFCYLSVSALTMLLSIDEVKKLGKVRIEISQKELPLFTVSRKKYNKDLISIETCTFERLTKIGCV